MGTAATLETLVDVAIAGAAVLSVLLALRAFARTPVLARIFLGGVVIVSVLAAFFAVMVSREPLDWTSPGAVSAARTGQPAAQPEPAAPPAVDPPRPAVVRPEPEAPPEPGASSPGEPARQDAASESPALFYATDRVAEVREASLGYGSERAHRLDVGRVLSAPATQSPGEQDEPRRVQSLDGAVWNGRLAEHLAKAESAGHALVVVHGWDTSFGAALTQARHVARATRFRGPVLVYSWPSGGRVASYTQDRDSAAEAAPFLRRAIEALGRDGGAKTISIVAFGLGCRVALDALDALRSAPPSGAALGEVALVGPDVDAAALASRVAALAGAARGVTLYSRGGDRGLDVSRRFHGGVARAGDVPQGAPLVLEGVTTIDMTAGDEDALLADLGRLLRSGEREPSRRTPELKSSATAGGSGYWVYSPAR